MDFGHPSVKIHLLPGGVMPQRMTAEASGYDVGARVIVSPAEKDPKNSRFRRTLFDFKHRPEYELEMRSRCVSFPGTSKLVYRMEPEEKLTIAIGFIVEMPRSLCYILLPRSGLASRWGLTLVNVGSLVDSDYRGEAAAVLRNDTDGPFDLEQGMRIAQILFLPSTFPVFLRVKSIGAFTETQRDFGAFGSTGLKS